MTGERKETVVGHVPACWSIKRLAEVSDFITKGGTPTTYGFDWADESNGIPFFRSECVTDEGFNPKGMNFIPAEAHHQMSRSEIKPGDLLMTITGNIGRVAKASERFSTANINQHIARIRVLSDTGANPDFVYQCLKHSAYAIYYRAILTGQAYPQISLEQVRGTPVAFPSLTEQKKIAAILTDVDNKIDVIARQIEATLTLKRGLTQTFFSRGVGTRYGANRWVPHAEFKDSELGKIPENWEVVPLGGLIQKLMDFRGRTPKKLGMDWGGGDIPALSANNVRMGYIDFNRECYLGSNELYSAWMVHGDTKKNDLVFTMEAPLGNVAVIPDDRKYILSQRVILLRPTELVSHSYLFQYLRSDAFAKILDVNATGTTAKGIQQKRLVQLPVVLPPLEEQSRIADVLGLLDGKLETLSAKQGHYQTLKRGLMQKLLTGEWRVKVDSPPGTA
ncbi:restriction endonuclease subunit S [Aquipseudomonas alcaligenes]|uniref:restriction endonuclease subunit S n=1 Tax=Aquipseudomonas alcaligenes TaxID=43263 RepID=UPI003669721D